MDYLGSFGREVAAFEAAGREAVSRPAAPEVPSCPGWVVTDLVLHLGLVHRLVAGVVGGRMQQPPAQDDLSWLTLPSPWLGWLPPGRAPRQSPVPADLVDWFQAGAQAPPGRGERFVFRRTDGPQTWAVRFDSDPVLLGPHADDYDVQISGTASDLALFLWHRDVTGSLEVQGDSSLVSRYFTLVPPV